MSNNPIKTANINVHNVSIPYMVIQNDESFGTFTVELEKTNIIKSTVFILFTIDRTGSMDEPGGKGMTKLEHLKYTFTNMLKFLSVQDATIYIRVHTFNRSVQILVDTIQINPTNGEEIINKIKKIKATGNTAIDRAIVAANEMISNLDTNQYSNITHIFMTDGAPTAGITDENKLASMVNDSFSNIFFGFGLDHNPQLLCKCSARKNAQYGFIDNIEQSGIVYGDIIHGILYPALHEVRICVENAKIYDWTTNAWVHELRESLWVSESRKNYHLSIPIDGYSDVLITLFGVLPEQDEEVLLETIDIMPHLRDAEGKLVTVDLSPFIFRQAVQECLYAVRQLMQKKQPPSIILNTKKRISLLFQKMRKFMREHDLTNDPIMKQLCDDLSISYTTLGTEHGLMYIAQRQGSQGRQQSNTTSTPRTQSMSPHTLDWNLADNNGLHYDEDTNDGFDDLSTIPPPPILRRSTVIRSPSVEIQEGPPCQNLYMDDENIDYEENMEGIYRNQGYRGERDPESGNKHGYGREVYPNRDTYAGDWENNLWNGQGIFTFADGRVFDGEFVYGVWQGEDNANYQIPVIPYLNDEDHIDHYIPSDNNISCYAPPSAVDTMRTMSQPML